MAYEVTATRKRPGRFDDLAGQEFVAATLKSSITSGRLAHAYLFSGPRGVGKTSAARILAKAVNCQAGPTAEPCGVCSSCQEIARGRSLDVIEIDGASNTSVNDIREIRDEVLFAPNSSRYKVYIIDEVHMLSNSAFNALLKTIEEPPPYVIFIFATTEIHKVPATIRSRCQQFNFRLIPLEEIRRLLEEVCREGGIQAEDGALLWIAKEATGSQRDAYTLFDQVAAFSGGKITQAGIKEKLGLVGLDDLNELMARVAAADGAGMMEKLNTILVQGVPVEQVLIDLSEYFRNLLLLRSGIEKESILGYKPESFPREIISAFSPNQLETGLEWLLRLYREIRYSLNQRYELELLLSRLAGLKAWLSPGEILAEIQSLREKIQAGVPAGTAVGSDAKAPSGSLAPGPGPGRAPSGSSGSPESSGPVPEVMAAAASAGVPVEAPREKGAGMEELKTALLAGARKHKLTLFATLEKAVRWAWEGDEVFLFFGNDFNARVAQEERAYLLERLAEISGRTLRLSIQVLEDSAPSGTPAGSEAVENIKEIFRGEIIRGGGENESF